MQKAGEAVSVVSDVVCDLGEGPIWSPDAQTLCWVDVTGRKLHCLDPRSNAVSTGALPSMPGSFAYRAGRGMIAAYRNRIALCDGVGAIETEVTGHGVDFSVERFNDGACDPAGRFWAGTFDPSLKGEGGSLYRVDPDQTVHKMDSGFAMSNGIGWSPDGRTMYFVDSRPGRIYSYAFDSDRGALGERTVFLDYDGAEGRPDGCAIDSEGHLWVAEVTAWRISRYTPDGRLDRSIRLPVSKPTSVGFGGSGLSTLYITTMRYGLSEPELEAEPLAGRLLAVDVDVPGLVDHRFAG